MKYSPYLNTVYDEQQPVGSIGRGTHYSILSCAQWRDDLLAPHSNGGALIQKFAVIWDEDHDQRIIGVIEAAYFEGLLAPVRFIGERKGSLTVIVEPTLLAFFDDDQHYLTQWQNIVNSVSGDYWPAYVYAHGNPESYGMIIHDSDVRVATYLQNINNLWSLSKEQSQYVMPNYCEPAI